LEPVSVEGSVFCFGPVSAPWRFEGGAPARTLFHVVVEGSAWLSVPGCEPRRLNAGDVVLVPRGGTHCMGSEPLGPAVPLGEAVSRDQGPFARFDIGGSGASSYLICGSFVVDGMSWHPLLRSLPDLVIVNAGSGRWLQPTLASMERYLDGHEPGAALITARLSEVLFVQTLATWLSQENPTDGWLRSLRDPQIARAIALMHAEPARGWTAERLGRAVGMSRSAFFGRFKALVDQTPAKYLTDWRMTLAARAFVTDRAPVGEVCERVGYASVPSFTKAFRKHHGQTPAAYRRAHA